MNISAETVSSLLGSLYEAAAAPEHWPGFFTELSACAQAQASYLVLVDPGGHCDIALNPGFDPAWQSAYSEYFYRKDILLDRFVALKNAHGDWIGTSQSAVSDQEYRGSSLYNEHIKPQGLLHHCAAVLGGLDGGIEGGLGMLRAPRSKPFADETIALLALLAPHLKRALNTHRAVSELRNRNEELRHSVEVLGQGLIRLDARGQVTQMTFAAQAILDARNGLVLEAGSLRASVPKEQLRLAELLAGAVATGSGRGTEVAVRCSKAAAPQAGSETLWTPPSGGAMLISRRPPAKPLRLVVTPFHSRAGILDERPVAMVFLNDPDARPASRSAILHDLYRLSPTECRLAEFLAQGLDLAGAADLLGMAAGTARFHLKTIFRKTGAGRQAELMRLLLALPGGWESGA